MRTLSVPESMPSAIAYCRCLSTSSSPMRQARDAIASRLAYALCSSSPSSAAFARAVAAAHQSDHAWWRGASTSRAARSACRAAWHPGWKLPSSRGARSASKLWIVRASLEAAAVDESRAPQPACAHTYSVLDAYGSAGSIPCACGWPAASGWPAACGWPWAGVALGQTRQSSARSASYSLDPGSAAHAGHSHS